MLRKQIRITMRNNLAKSPNIRVIAKFIPR